MDKQFFIFQAIAPADFKEQLIAYWMKDEDSTRETVLMNYGGEDLELLCRNLIGKIRTYEPDLGYTDDSTNGTLCFEEADNNFVIPVNILHYAGTNQ